MSLAPRGKILPSCSPRPEEAILSELARLNLESWANFEGRIKKCGYLKRPTSLGPSLSPRRTTLTLIKHRIISAINRAYGCDIRAIGPPIFLSQPPEQVLPVHPPRSVAQVFSSYGLKYRNYHG
jgi:hypothetical protein